MIFCKRKTERVEAFRVGHHLIPDWLKSEIKTGYNQGKHIEVNKQFGIKIDFPEFTAVSGDWIVKKTDGQLTKYSNEEFKNLFEILEDNYAE